MSTVTLTGILSEIRQQLTYVDHKEAIDMAIAIIDPTPPTSSRDLEIKYTGSHSPGEHPQFSREDWRDEVAAEDTDLGYWDWAFNKVKDEEQP